MMELGEIAPLAHFDVGVHVAKAGVGLLVAIGQWASQMVKGARSVNPEMDVAVCMDNEEALAVLARRVGKGDCVLVKGSRGMKTDEIVKSFLQAHNIEKGEL